MSTNDINKKDLNLYDKIQMVKLGLSQAELKKSGENKFSGFTYYELGDFIPTIIALCADYGLFTHISFSNKEGILTITDTNKDHAVTTEMGYTLYDSIDYICPLKEVELKGANAIQSLGATQTYIRRYLYMNAFDIVEADAFDSKDFEKKKKQKAEKGILDVLIADCKKAFKDGNAEVKKKVGNTMKTLGYASFGELGTKQEKDDIIALAQVLKVEIPKELLIEEK